MNPRLLVLVKTAFVAFVAYSCFTTYSRVVPYSLVFNRTESIPIGLYWAEDIRASKLSRGDIACFPYATPDWAKDRRYLPDGLTVCKPVAGLPGDMVKREGNKLFVSYAETPQVSKMLGEYATHDSRKRPLPQDMLPMGAVPEGTLLMVAGAHANSLDSRYVGYIPAYTIQRRIHPIYTW